MPRGRGVNYMFEMLVRKKEGSLSFVHIMGKMNYYRVSIGRYLAKGNFNF